MIKSQFFIYILEAKHGPAVSVIPVFRPLNPLFSSLFVFNHLFLKILVFHGSIILVISQTIKTFGLNYLSK